MIYTNKCSINTDNVMPLLSMAMEYGMEQLIKICEKFISSSINIENACCSMQAAVTFGLDNFKRTLLPFIEQNTAEIFKTKSFNELSETTLSYILQSDELTMDEYDLMKAIKGWAVVNSVALGRPLSEISRTVVCNLRLSLLSAEELARLETENMKEHFIPVEQISMAWKHLALKTPLHSTLDTTPRKGTIPRKK
uniref:BACK domain-containing protein n=1 Tax=Clytia hemisphaerica TaxID=252671 RepID=A0A7M5XFC3_9CNID